MPRRGRPRRTHCPHGHEITPANTYRYVDRDGYVIRQCKTCQCERSRKRHEVSARHSKYRHMRIRVLDDVRKFVAVDPQSGCWMWQRGTGGDGYARAFFRGTQQGVHRIVLILAGRDPAGLFACHRCDRPACVNPDHLFVGTNADNIQDMWNKGRRSREHIAQRKLA